MPLTLRSCFCSSKLKISSARQFWKPNGTSKSHCFASGKQISMSNLTGITTIEAFAGIGVASLAFKSQGATPLLVIEKDVHALAICQRNLKPQHVHSDILDFDGKGWKCHVLMFGAVCKAHSKSGNGKGLGDKDVALVHRAAMQMVRDVDFKVAIVECAPELLEPQFKADLAEWRMAFMRRGCDVQFRVIDAADFNLPQSRRRTIMIATRGDANVDEIVGVMFPKALPHTATVEAILQSHVADDQHLGRIAFNEVVWKTKLRRSHRGLKQIGCIGGKPGQGYRVYDPKAPVGPTITATGGGRARCTNAYLIDGKVRGLTAREACRMQGLPEWFEHDAHTGRALKQAGNALAYPLFQALGTQLASVLKPRT
jgi:site-specific DNA-cytosine methylase